MYNTYTKRIFDFLFSLIISILLFSILFIFVVLLILLHKTNPFFFQLRVGKDEQIFTIVKLKTMNDKRDATGVLLPDNERITPLGKFIRKTSLDEIPQLLNVLKGEMSLVGPRPLLVQYLPLYTVQQKRRHDVKPGITGWAQVNGRNSISWRDKFNLDVWYVDNQSFWLDLKILFLTIKKILVAEGVNQTSDTTMEAFNGKN